MKGYKGFDKDLKCRDFQYEIGKTYETDEAKLCEKGFHFCEAPFDVLNYYAIVDDNGNFSFYHRLFRYLANDHLGHLQRTEADPL